MPTTSQLVLHASGVEGEAGIAGIVCLRPPCIQDPQVLGLSHPWPALPAEPRLVRSHSNPHATDDIRTKLLPSGEAPTQATLVPELTQMELGITFFPNLVPKALQP